MNCSQCTNQAMYNVAGYPLCLHCYTKFQMVMQQQQAERAAMINYLSEQIGYTMGTRSAPPRLEIPQPIINQAPLKINHIEISNSVVGAINTADAATLNVSLNQIQVGVDNELAQQLAGIVNAISEHTNIDADSKKEMLEQLTFLSQELAGRRARKSIFSPILKGIARTLSVFSDLSTLWERVSPLIMSALQ